MVFALWLVLGLPSAVSRGSEEKESGDWGQEEERGQGQSWVFRVLEGCQSYDEISICEVVLWEFLRGPSLACEPAPRPGQGSWAVVPAAAKPGVAGQGRLGWVGLGWAGLRERREFFASRLINAYIGQGLLFRWAVTRSLSKFASLD